MCLHHQCIKKTKYTRAQNERELTSELLHCFLWLFRFSFLWTLNTNVHEYFNFINQIAISSFFAIIFLDKWTRKKILVAHTYKNIKLTKVRDGPRDMKKPMFSVYMNVSGGYALHSLLLPDFIFASSVLFFHFQSASVNTIDSSLRLRFAERFTTFYSNSPMYTLSILCNTKLFHYNAYISGDLMFMSFRGHIKMPIEPNFRVCKWKDSNQCVTAIERERERRRARKKSLAHIAWKFLRARE